MQSQAGNNLAGKMIDAYTDGLQHDGSLAPKRLAARVSHRFQLT
jgi:hypothetical protein